MFLNLIYIFISEQIFYHLVLLPKSKSKCETERQSVFDSFPLIDGKRVPLLGGYMPQCNEDGSYKDVQCQEMFCWCVHQNGTKKEGTEARLAKPNCSTGMHKTQSVNS